MSQPRGPLSRTAILTAAVRYADTHSLSALTMRRLGEALGVEAMSLYHYVNGREDLLEGMVGMIVTGVDIPTDQALGPADGWQAFLQHVAHQVRAVSVAHPNLFPLVATRPPSAPWLRPPLRSLDLVEDFLSGLGARGLSDTQVVHVYKVFTSFLLGHLLLEVAMAGAETGPVEEPLDEGSAPVPNQDQGADVAAHASVVRLQDRLTDHDPQTEFEQSLEALLDRLDGELSQ